MDGDDGCESKTEVRHTFEAGKTGYQASMKEMKKCFWETIDNAKDALEAGKNRLTTAGDHKCISKIIEETKKFFCKIKETVTNIFEGDTLECEREKYERTIDYSMEAINKAKESVCRTIEDGEDVNSSRTRIRIFIN